LGIVEAAISTGWSGRMPLLSTKQQRKSRQWFKANTAKSYHYVNKQNIVNEMKLKEIK